MTDEAQKTRNREEFARRVKSIIGDAYLQMGVANGVSEDPDRWIREIGIALGYVNHARLQLEAARAQHQAKEGTDA